MTQTAKNILRQFNYARRLRHSFGGRCAQVVSDVLSPLLIPTYAYIVMMWLTPMVLVPERIRMITVIVVAIATGALPLAMILSLRRIGYIKDNAISNRRQRILPFAITVVCYAGTAIYLYNIGAFTWVYRFFAGAALACALAAVISLKSKISAHTSAISGMAMLILWLAFRRLLIIHPMAVLTVAIMLCGLVGSCRLRLLRHNLLQVLCGYLLGAASVFIALTI